MVLHFKSIEINILELENVQMCDVSKARDKTERRIFITKTGSVAIREKKL